MIERIIMKHKQDIYARFTAVTNDYLHYAAVTKHLCEKHLGTYDFEVSSIISPYSHLDYSRLYNPKTEDSLDSKGEPTWLVKELVESPSQEVKEKENGENKSESKNLEPILKVKEKEIYEENKSDSGTAEATAKKRGVVVAHLDNLVCSPIREVKKKRISESATESV